MSFRTKSWLGALAASAMLMACNGPAGPEPENDSRQLPVAADDDSGHSILALMPTVADLDSAAQMPTRAARTRAVYDTLRRTARAEQQALVSWLSARGIAHRQHYLLNAVSITGLTKEQVEEIAARKDVRRILPNDPVRLLDDPTVNFPGTEGGNLGVGSNISYIDADRAWEELGARGQGIVVAGQDTGVDWDHPALVGQYRGRTESGTNHDYNWHDAITTGSGTSCGIASQTPCDDHSHGTHTLGTAIGHDGGSNQIGVAPDAQWIACRNMKSGVGRPSTYISCFEFFLAPFPYGGDPLEEGEPALAAHVMNNSWGCDSSEQCVSGEEFRPVLQALRTAGVFVVVSAGNSGSSCGSIEAQPATHSDLAFTVGAVSHSSGNIASFSSRGPSSWDGGVGPDVTAPGVNVRSAVPGGGYSGFAWSGTSMAGPHVAGLVALMWSANADMVGEIDATEEIIRQTARPRGGASCGSPSARPNNTYGWGIIDAFDAVKAAQEWTPTAP